MDFPIVSEYATGLAAFRSGQIYQYPVRSEEMLGVKRDIADLALYQGDLVLPASAATLFFGYKNTQRGMFRDKRLRQAYSMSIDRDLFAETWFNVSNFTSQGLPVTTAWSSAVPANEYTGWWLDPRDKNFGPNGKYYQLNVAEAKKLISAAGFSSGVEYISTRAGGNYGPEYDRQIEIMEGMAADAGFRPRANVVQYQNDLIPNYQNVQGEFEGIAWMLRPQSSSDPIDKLAENLFSKSGPNFIGFDTAGKGDHTGDTFVDDQIRKSRVERDTVKRKQLMTDLQKYLGDQMYLIRPVAGASGFELAWPALRNFLYYRGARRSEEWSYFWLDSTLKPLGGS
jgi:ABC-type transport system substrate-binding protein